MTFLSLTLRGILVLALMFPPAALAKKKPPAQPVNINMASSAQLQSVPGIGPATADKILQMRKSYGAFKSVNDLLAIRGLGPKRLDKMRKYLVVGRTPAAKTGSPSAACKGCGKLKSPPASKAPPVTAVLPQGPTVPVPVEEEGP